LISKHEGVDPSSDEGNKEVKRAPKGKKRGKPGERREESQKKPEERDVETPFTGKGPAVAYYEVRPDELRVIHDQIPERPRGPGRRMRIVGGGGKDTSRRAPQILGRAIFQRAKVRSNGNP